MKVYEGSKQKDRSCSCFMARDDGGKFLIVEGGDASGEFTGNEMTIEGRMVKKCHLDVHNSRIIREIFPFTAPVSVGDRKFSFGAGDRLGIASPGHIRVLRNKGIFPVLAQQSIRELNLTGRTYDDVLADVTWAVLQEGYRDGYGADGDHLKTKDEVNMALKAGFSMITLDCSEHIGTADQKASYGHMEKYRNMEFSVGRGIFIHITDEIFDETMDVYAGALGFANGIYNDILKDRNNTDFELSIDETSEPTRPEAHFLIAAWLRDAGVKVVNIAPRFCGEFQKGIDYRGDLEQFKREFAMHGAIADFFGHRLSIHSGSDKFSVFPTIGSETGLNCHVKTAGTNWLEAMRCIAEKSPELFREMYTFALKILHRAKQYYHISTEVSMVPLEKDFNDDELTELLGIDESRQALHVTYGFLLDDSNEKNLRQRFFNVMNGHEELYYMHLEDHIGRHINALMSG